MVRCSTGEGAKRLLSAGEYSPTLSCVLSRYPHCRVLLACLHGMLLALPCTLWSSLMVRLPFLKHSNSFPSLFQLLPDTSTGGSVAYAWGEDAAKEYASPREIVSLSASRTASVTPAALSTTILTRMLKRILIRISIITNFDSYWI